MSNTPIALFERFESIAHRAPARGLVLEAGHPPVSASRLLDLALEASRALKTEGASEGDLILMTHASGASFVAGMLAIWACDAVALPADVSQTEREIQDLGRSFAPRLTLRAEGGRLAASKAPSPDGSKLPHETCVIKLTSGTTGGPRGIRVTADQLLADATQIIETMAIGPQDVNIAAIPLSHSYGMDSLLMPLVVQGSPLLMVPSALPDPLARALSIEEDAVFPGVPYLFEMLSRADGPAVVRRGLKTCLSAGAPLSCRTAAAFRERLGLPVRAFYGTSETGGICYDASPEGDAASRGDGCVGTPMTGVTVTLQGEEGRVVVSGPNVAAGYLGTTPEEDPAFVNGSFRTGDTGRLDEQGRLHLMGRLGGLVNVAGRKVNPLEVEAALLGMAGVRAAAILGEPDEARGQSLAAVVVADALLTRRDVIEHLKGKLAPHKLPRRVIFVAEIPVNERGKRDERAIKALLASA